MNADDVSRWYADYLQAFAACGRGERPVEDLLEFYGVPMVLTTDDTVSTFLTPEQSLGWASAQGEGMRAAGYQRTQEWAEATVTVLNRTSALYRAALARVRADGSEISRFAFTYLITDGPSGRRISALIVQPA